AVDCGGGMGHVSESVFTLGELRFCLLALCHVAHDGQELVGVGVNDASLKPSRLAPYRKAVFMDLKLAGLLSAPEAIEDVFGQVRRQHVAHILAKELLGSHEQVACVLAVKTNV